nr:MBL fold metallo-hydrolase [Methanobacterium sp. SMA-27]
MVDDFATITQRRMTGGFRIENIDGKNIHVDPGPGALVRTYQFGLNPMKVNILMVSHSHTDHYSDAEVMLEAMTNGMTRKKGTVIGSRSVIDGYETWGPCISKYHLSKPEVVVLEDCDHKRFDNLDITATKTIHGDPKAVGFKLEYDNFTISYTTDTEYFPELHKHHEGADVLIASVIRAGSERIRGHMSVDDFEVLVKEVKPKLAIMTHLGMKFIMEYPEREAQRVEKNTGVKIIAARDGMRIDLDDFQTKQPTLDEF